LSSRIRGEAREAAKVLAGIAEECADTGTPVEPPAVLLSGCETTVTVRADGTDGPNQEFVLSAALDLTELVTVASVDTDGIDGVFRGAGAVATPATAQPRRDGHKALRNNEAGRFLDARDPLVVTGPTGTNINNVCAFVNSRNPNVCPDRLILMFCR
jgi:hydroxypyruvate reductase